mgnify:CR=1 FL=1
MRHKKRKPVRKDSVTPKSKQKIFFRGVKRIHKEARYIQEFDEPDPDDEMEREAREFTERLTDLD